jgi:hypothetical protein
VSAGRESSQPSGEEGKRRNANRGGRRMPESRDISGRGRGKERLAFAKQIRLLVVPATAAAPAAAVVVVLVAVVAVVVAVAEPLMMVTKKTMIIAATISATTTASTAAAATERRSDLQLGLMIMMIMVMMMMTMIMIKIRLLINETHMKLAAAREQGKEQGKEGYIRVLPSMMVCFIDILISLERASETQMVLLRISLIAICQLQFQR